MNEIPSAKLSPRIEEGKLYWYYLDTFPLELTINLTDGHTGEVIEIQPEDEIIISFFRGSAAKNCRFEPSQKDLVFTKTFTNIKKNIINLYFDDELSAKFEPGTYSYYIKYNYKDIRTIAALNEVEVEECR